MTDTDKQSAIEATARAIAGHLTPGWDKIHADKTHWRATHGMLEGIYRDVNGPFQDDCREAARAAIRAYLGALVEDEGAVEAVAEIIGDDMDASDRHCEFHYKAARAVLRTLLTRAQGEKT
jgi:hypothetical protein